MVNISILAGGKWISNEFEDYLLPGYAIIICLFPVLSSVEAMMWRHG
jgi:archaellum component FlaF (FlaF/FlaG flagellin family)